MLAAQHGESVADYLLFILILVSPVLGVIWFAGWMLFAWMPFSSEIVAYPIMCYGVIDKDHCKGETTLLDPVAYKVFEERQAVILQTSITAPLELQKCVVRNKHNWSCDLWPVHGTLQMIGGELSSSNDKSKYVPKWKWWTCKLGLGRCDRGWSKK